MTAVRGINVVSIAVPELDAARAFYGTVLGTGAPGGNLAVTRAEPGWAPSTGTTVVLNTDDCHAACAGLRARGVRCEDPVVFPGYVTFFSFYDPFGNRLQMCSPAPAA